MRWSLAGKRALVTGATKGIGAAVVQELCSLGASVVAVARNSADVEQCVETWRKAGYDIRGVTADVAAADGRQIVVDTIHSVWDALHIVVNNVGTNVRKKTMQYTADEYDALMNTNLRSMFEMCRLCYPLLQRAEGASIVNMSSVAGLAHVRTGVIYGMSKAAIVQLTRNLAVEWAPDGIRVNAVAPWYIHTPLADTVLRDDAYRAEVLARTPMRTIGKPEDVAGTVAFLCMEPSAYITGQCLCVDGGFSVYGF